MKKRTIVFVACAFCCIGLGKLYAQTTTSESGIKTTNPGGIYIKGGWNLANITKDESGSINSKTNLSTFNVGVLGDIPLNDMFSVQTGLFLQGRGAKTDQYFNDSHTDYLKTRFKPLYLQLPVDFAVKIPLGNDVRLFLGAGPYVEMGIGGKAKTELSIAGVTTSSSSTIKFNDDDPTTSQQEGARYDRLKRFGFGINGVGGIEAGRFMVGVGYDWGLTKINSTQTNSDANDKNKYRTFSVNVGVRLN
jgi:hypothetical protein